MTVKDIQQALYSQFYNHDYHLYNSYVYGEGWESDYFSITKSGYCYEVEIKLTRSDFFVDFKKPKHQLFTKIFSGLTKFFTKSYEGVGSLICTFESKVLKTKRWGYAKRSNENFPAGTSYDFRTELYTTNDTYNVWLEPRREYIYAKATHIKLFDLNKRNCPHRFYYAVPVGLVKADELPPYAGLLYVDKGSIKVVKQAPFLHKQPHTLHMTLLDKFYYECVRHRIARRHNTGDITAS